MISIKTALGSVFDQKAKCRVLFLPEETGKNTQLKQFEEAFDGLSQIIKDREFTGKLLSHIAVPVSDEDHLYYMVLVGLGAGKGKNPIAIEHYRRAVGKALRIAEDLNVDSVALALPDPDLFGVTHEALAEQTASILEIAHYKFDTYLTGKDQKVRDCKATIALEGQPKGKIDLGVERGILVGKAVNQARHWIDLPPMLLTPHELAGKAEEISQKYGIDCTVFSEEDVNRMGMGGLAGVSRGSDNDCKLVIMEYKAPNKNAPTLAFVGKGITFDSGGLSLKPAVHMETMKEDMSGAAAVISAMSVIAQLKPDVNVIGVAPISENLPSGKATKPGDILTFYNGKTAEVKNTDAEGRLILADALSYVAKHYKPDAIIDIATLTGSCAHALGPFFTGLMSQDKPLIAAIEDAAVRSGDRVWQLPLDDDYKPAIKSIVADICNIGSNKYMAGAITAGHFLANFVGEIPWAHLDIAGTAFDVPDLSYYRPGSATGVGVRLLIDVALNWPTSKAK